MINDQNNYCPDENLPPCCNNLFPGQGNEFVNHSIIYCSGDDEINVMGWNCGTYWNNLVLSTDDKLYFKACDARPITIKPIESIVGENYKEKPRLSWNFVFGHGYVIKKKVGSGQWTTVKQITNRNTQYWVNSNQSLPPIRRIYYKVYTRLFYSLANTAPQFYFDPPSK